VRRLALFAFAALAACNAITGLSDDFRLASAPLDAGGDDDAPAEPPPPPPPPGDDAGDSGSTPDAPIEAGAFCTDAGALSADSGVVFCTDFEGNDPPPTYGWSATDLVEGGVTVGAGYGVGGTHGMRAFAANMPTSRHAALVETFAGVPSAHYDLSFSFEVKGTPAFSYFVVGLVGFNVAGSSNYYGLAEHNESLLDISTPPGATDNIGVTDPHDVWHTAVIALDRRDGGATYDGTITVDGTVVDTYSGLGTNNKPAEVHVGVFYSSTEPGTAEVWIDNVVVHRH
jgi:hypothetical protein